MAEGRSMTRPDERPDEHKRENSRFFLSTVGAIPFVALIALLIALFFLSTVAARAADAQQMPEPAMVGDGEVSGVNGGELYAGDGCAKAGVVVAGNCKESDEKDEGEDPSGSSPGEAPAEGTTSEAAAPEETTTVQERTDGLDTTLSETASPEDTVAKKSGEASACPSEPPDDAVQATVEDEIDGDTLEIEDETHGTDRVRLIGVDTPELEGEDGQPEPYAQEAASFTAGALEGEDVLLEIGEEETDEYGRLLAYVWKPEEKNHGLLAGLKRLVGMGGPELFNETLLKEGYARVLTIEPNDAYAGCFEAAQGRARDEGAGLWGLPDGIETTFEQALPETTVLEQTAPEEADLAPDTPEESTSEAPASRNSAPDESPAENQYSAENPGSTSKVSVPDYQKCEAPDFLTGVIGEGERTKSIEVPGRSFLLAYRTQTLQEDEDGLLRIDVYGSGDTLIDQISYEKVGTGRTYVEAGPGTFEISASSENRSYHIAVYACGDDVTAAGAGALEATEMAQGAPADSSAQEQAALPLTTQNADAPAESTIQEAPPLQTADFEPVAPSTSAAGQAGVVHLPETGGAGFVGPALGVLLLAVGALSFALRACGRRDDRYGAGG